ncbi:hypothetical protein ACFV0G_23065, partial [Kitasatospora sp. NPDC059571]
MATEEKRAWIMVLVTVCAYASYAAVVLGRAGGGPLSAAPYRGALLWSVGLAIAASIVLNIAAAGGAGGWGARARRRAGARGRARAPPRAAPPPRDRERRLRGLPARLAQRVRGLRG